MGIGKRPGDNYCFLGDSRIASTCQSLARVVSGFASGVSGISVRGLDGVALEDTHIKIMHPRPFPLVPHMANLMLLIMCTG